MLKRKVYKELLEWKNKKNKECLLVKGARQVGKTFIIEQFGKENYKNYLYINFFLSPETCDIFEGSLKAEDIYKKISLYFPEINLAPHETLIFLDEIQECPNARTALKFLAIDNQFDVIASGSLLGISYKPVPSIPVGYERQIVMYPLDFEEFLWATNMSDETISYVKSFFDKKIKVDNGVNKKMLEKLREYMVVGGMPAVVNAYLETNNFAEVHRTQQVILNTYLDDFTKYPENVEKTKVRDCYLSIPRQLAKENTKFKYSVVEKGSSARKYGCSVEWLRDANLVNIIHNVSLPTIPLNAYEKEDQFKVYLNDIGLIVAMYGYDIKALIMSNKLTGPAKGGIYENLVSDILVKRGHKLNYYKTDDNSEEIEFLIEQNASVIPIEVKSGNGASASLNKFIEKFNPPYAYKIITGNLGIADKKITLPLYMAMFI